MLRRFLTALCCVLLASSLASAQTARGDINGTVRDPNGAAVVGATVEATNNATGEKRTATTNDEGVYTLTNLNAGSYTLTVSAPGFGNSTVKDVNVTVAFTLTQDVSLAPSGAQEIVTVSGQDAQVAVNTTDQQISTLINQRKINDLPLLSRDPNSLLLLAPGTNFSTSRLGGITVNGQRERNNNFLVDGIDNNDTSVPGIPGGISTPNIDATQEFRVITNNFTAEFGRNTGGIVNVATRSGSNDFRGAAYIYYRSDAFAARNFFSDERAPLQRRQFGGSIGGPIKKDRTFFFFNYERDDFDQGIDEERVVPTAAARQGIFNLTSIGGPVIDAREAGANNAFGLPINAGLQGLLNTLYPLPNQGGDGPLPGVFEFYRFTTQTNDLQDQISTRVDHRISEKHNFAASFALTDGTFEACCESFPNANDSILTPQRTYRLSTNLVSTFSSSFINEFRLGGNRTELIFAGEGDFGVSAGRGEAVLAALKKAGAPAATEQFGGINGSLINLTIGGIFGPGNGATGGSFFDTQRRYTGTTHLGDTVSWIKGDHTFKFGGETRFVYENGASNFFRQEYLDFSVPTTFEFPILVDDEGEFLPISGSFGTVQNFASYLYGFVANQFQFQYFNKNGTRVDEDYRGYRQRDWEVFFQDSWKVKPNLTLNLGLRYEFKGVPWEVNGQMSNLVGQDPSGKTPAGGFVFQLVGKNSGGSSKIYEDDRNNFAPRVGFAYSPDFKEGWLASLTGGPGRMSIRGGYGIFYDRVFGNLFSNTSSNPPFQRTINEFPGDFIEVIGRPETQTATAVVLDDEFQQPVLFVLPGNNKLQGKLAMPYTQAWNVGFQRQFKGDVLIESDYVGSKSTGLLRAFDGNMTSVTRVNAILGLSRNISPTSTFTNFTNGSLNTAFFQATMNSSLGHATFHSGQFRITKNFTESRYGLGSIQAAYTLSHSIDNAADPIDAQTGERSFPRDSSGFVGGFASDRGNSGFDVRHRFVGSMVYEIPVRFENWLLRGAFGNWTMSGIWQWQSGSPYTPFGGTDSAGTALGQRASYAIPGAPTGNFTRLAPPTTVDPRTQTGPTRDQFRNPCPGNLVTGPNSCGSSPLGVLGNVGRNSLYGPGYNNVDFSAIKRFPFGEDGRFKFTLRADFFNLFNNVNFGKPVNTINSTNFGQSIDAYPARRIQFVGRFDF
ncbi:MAG TPA: TonB-dependent receptor [Pyrinomonadaceae bacterium]|nr:TonB-dependent receptor [Pyrinomonadaceae bacterium]